MRVRSVVRAGLLVLVLAGVVAGGLARLAWMQLHTAYQGYAGGEQFIDIPRGVGTAGVAGRLAQAGVVRNPWLVRLAVWWSDAGRSLKAGEYRFDHPMTPLDVVGVLARGEVYERRLTFPEGLTIAEMGALFESHGFGRAVVSSSRFSRSYFRWPSEVAVLAGGTCGRSTLRVMPRRR